MIDDDKHSDNASEADDGNRDSDNDNNDTGDKHHDGEDGNNATDHDGGNDDDVIHVAATPTSPALLSQLAHSHEYTRARGPGAGHTGAATFLAQRLTAMALVPLAIWFAVSVLRMSRGDHADAAAWLTWPVNAVLMALFIAVALRHAVIGIRIILEDYVPHPAWRNTCVIVVQALAWVLAVAAVAALVHLAL